MTDTTVQGGSALEQAEQIIDQTERSVLSGPVEEVAEGVLRATVLEQADTILALREELKAATRMAEARLSDYENIHRKLQESRMLHAADMAAVSEHLNDEAESRGWCDEFDVLVGKLNRVLNVPLDLRYVEKEFTVTGYIRVPFTHSFTASVPGGATRVDQEEAAMEQWSDNYRASDTDYDLDDAEFMDYGLEVTAD